MNAPGRFCPARYRYGAAALATAAEVRAETVYVVGGLYGNLPALDAIEAMAAAELGPVTLFFNGDFNWFDVAPGQFAALNRRVLAHRAIQGNVEAELGPDGGAAGYCGQSTGCRRLCPRRHGCQQEQGSHNGSPVNPHPRSAGPRACRDGGCHRCSIGS